MSSVPSSALFFTFVKEFSGHFTSFFCLFFTFLVKKKAVMCSYKSRQQKTLAFGADGGEVALKKLKPMSLKSETNRKISKNHHL
jgi:hypothetical protein